LEEVVGGEDYRGKCPFASFEWGIVLLDLVESFFLLRSKVRDEITELLEGERVVVIEGVCLEEIGFNWLEC
jgi:hypothetical protein